MGGAARAVQSPPYPRRRDLSSWSCRHESNGICKKVDGAYCRPGMKGCVLVGKVKFADGVIPSPVWPPDAERTPRPAEPPGEGSGRR